MDGLVGMAGSQSGWLLVLLCVEAASCGLRGHEAADCRTPGVSRLVLAQWWAEPGSRIVIVGSGFPDLVLACWQEELAPTQLAVGSGVS